MKLTGFMVLCRSGTNVALLRFFARAARRIDDTASETDTYAQATKDVTVTINKANAVAATVTANSRTYDGTEKPLVTVDNSTLVGGEMQYALGTANEATQPYTTSIPTATEAGTYYVWYKTVGDENHSDTVAETPVTVTIAPAAITITPADKSSKYLSTLQELTYQVGGAYHEGDELNVILSTTATATSVVGTYAITVQSWENANYTATL